MAIKIPDKTFLFLAERANNLCEYCKCRSDYSHDTFESEHIYPFLLGGTNELINLAHSCKGCNSRKATRIAAIDPLTKQITPLFHPRLDLWNEHFMWDEGYLNVIGITPVGRTTVDALKLNRIGVVNLRKLMILGGIHPPIY
jgi:hypothetical protein